MDGSRSSERASRNMLLEQEAKMPSKTDSESIEHLLRLMQRCDKEANSDWHRQRADWKPRFGLNSLSMLLLDGYAKGSRALHKPRSTSSKHSARQLSKSSAEPMARRFSVTGDARMDSDGQLQGEKKYRVRTFTLAGQRSRLFMLAADCAEELGYQNPYHMLRAHYAHSLLHMICTTVEETEDLIKRNVVSASYRSRTILVVTARSVFRTFGSRMVDDVPQTQLQRSALYLRHPSSSRLSLSDAMDKLWRESLYQTMCKTEPGGGSARCSGSGVQAISMMKPAAKDHDDERAPSNGSRSCKDLGTSCHLDERPSLELVLHGTRSPPEEVGCTSKLEISTCADRHIATQTLVADEKAESRSSTVNETKSENAGRSSLLVAIYMFYALCRQSIELAVNAADQQLLQHGPGSEDQFTMPQATSSNASNAPIENSQANDDQSSHAPDGNETRPKTARAGLSRMSTTSTEFPCWWYISDPLRYNFCRKYCSRRRKLHSFRRHHFEDHWRWGDVHEAGVSYDTWKAAKHANCDLPDLTEDERDRRKWELTYRIYFGLGETDPIPQPICPDPRHVIVKPKRPFVHEIPTTDPRNAQQDSYRPPNNQPETNPNAVHNNATPDGNFETSTLEPNSSAPLFPELNLDEHGDPLSFSSYLTAWNDHFHAARDLVATSSVVQSLRLVVDEHILRVRSTFETMCNDPSGISLHAIETVFQLTRNFETDLVQASLHSRVPTDSATLAYAQFHPNSNLPASTNTQHDLPIGWEMDQSGTSSTIDGPPAGFESQHDGETNGSVGLDMPRTPRLFEDPFVLIRSSDTDERVDGQIPDSKESRASYFPNRDQGATGLLPEEVNWSTSPPFQRG